MGYKYGNLESTETNCIAEILIRKLQGKKVKKQGFDFYFYEYQLVEGEKGALLEATSCCKH